MLDILVQIDLWMSATSKLADYVIALKIWLETAGTSQVLDWLTVKVRPHRPISPTAGR